ncbi:MAG: TIM-barrel domain-containing protein, partial [Pseudomonadota bacterium]
QAGLAGGHFLADAGGQPWLGVVWPGQSVFPDFSSAAARSWWASLVPRLTGPGVRGIWLDMNEPTTFQAEHANSLPDSLVAAGDGWPTTLAELHNAYALLEAQATHTGLVAAAPDRRPFILTRAGFAGIQRVAAVWTGDAHTSWESLRGTLPMLLGLGLSGVGLCGSDVGGYSGGPSPGLFARWMQLGAVSPFFRDHVNTDAPDQEPWAFGPEVEAISRAVIQERYRLLPYLYSLMHQAHTDGAPLLRPLVWEFQADPATHTLDDQAMLGPWLLLAPVLSDGVATRTFYLPAGRWFELHSGAVLEGPATIVRAVSLAAWPAFVRQGAILPRSDVMQFSDQRPVDPLFLDVYPGPGESDFMLIEDDGDGFGYRTGQIARTPYRLEGLAGGAVLEAGPRTGDWAPPARTLVVRVRRVDHDVGAVRLDGVRLPAHASYAALMAAGNGYWADPWDRSLVVALADRGSFRLEFDYDPSLAQPEPWVEVPFRVRVPDGTPAGDTIHVATSAHGWSHLPLTWSAEPGVVEGRIPLPRGAWFEYKITRGDWTTVEKWAGCLEATNRYGLAAAQPVREDVVASWADWCR